jgi:hypothetical protein
MAKDMIHDDEWYDQENGKEKVQTATPKSGGGGSHATLKDYVIVALIAIVAVMGINNYLYARSGPGAGSLFGGGGCCSSGGGGAAAPSAVELEQLGVAYYVEATGDEEDDVRAAVQDFGCHQEIYIYKGDQQVMRLGYANGDVYQL